MFDEILSGLRDKFQKRVTCVAFSIKFVKTKQKFAENSEFCEKNSLLLVNYSLHSLGLLPHLRLGAQVEEVAPLSLQHEEDNEWRASGRRERLPLAGERSGRNSAEIRRDR